jgi:hypothetical protein
MNMMKLERALMVELEDAELCRIEERHGDVFSALNLDF